jgi:hypothetical protein
MPVDDNFYIKERIIERIKAGVPVPAHVSAFLERGEQ